jgi:hypothetical protein
MLPLQHGNSSEATWSLQQGDAVAVASATPPDLKPNVHDTPLGLQSKIQKLGGDAAVAIRLTRDREKPGGG